MCLCTQLHALILLLSCKILVLAGNGEGGGECQCHESQQTDGSRPNIVIIIADDMVIKIVIIDRNFCYCFRYLYSSLFIYTSLLFCMEFLS